MHGLYSYRSRRRLLFVHQKHNDSRATSERVDVLFKTWILADELFLSRGLRTIFLIVSNCEGIEGLSG